MSAPAKHTPGPWRQGKAGGIVSDHPVPEMSGADAVEYYGGHLIAESIAPRNRPLICAAPEMLDALERAERKLYAYVGVCKGDKELTDAVLPMVGAAIAKARGAA